MEQTVAPELSAAILSPSSAPTAASISDASLVPASRIASVFANSIGTSPSVNPSPAAASLPPLYSHRSPDLISARLNPRILSLSDEFFAPAANLLSPLPPIRKPNTYVATGAWYDGWETRRHNPSAYDHVVVRLGPAAGRVRGVEVDTAFFDGNHAPAVSVEGAYEPASSADENAQGDDATDRKVADEGYGGWFELLGTRACGPSARHAWRVPPQDGAGPPAVTHVRLRMYPDGGIARFRLYGAAVPAWPATTTTTTSSSSTSTGAAANDAAPVELSAALHGGRAVGWSDQHFGAAANLLLPGRGVDMGDGWETARSRGVGHADWAVVRLAARARGLGRVVVDTLHFRGNFPRAVRVEACDVGAEAFEREAEEEGEGQTEGKGGLEEMGEKVLEGLGRRAPAWEGAGWVTVVPDRKMAADEEAVMEGPALQGCEGKTFSHVRLVIIPDGGVKRLRVFGTRV